MDLLSQFKKHYLHYLVSIIIPTIITAVSIPLFKLLLGAASYGNFAIIFNSVLICTATLTGWISQSVIRYYPSSLNKQFFVKQSLSLSIKTQGLFILPVFLVVWYFNNDWILAFFFCATLFISALQFTIVSISQSIFLSKKNIFSEFIRTVTYILTAIFLLKYTSLNFLYSLFSAIIISYTLSFIYLNKQVKKALLAKQNKEQESFKVFSKRFLKYGLPLSFWFIFAYLITLTDKLFIRQIVGGEVQGNYQAIFDLISKSITLIISPVIISLFPLLTTAFAKGENQEIKRLLVKIILFEFAGLVITTVAYWWFGADLLFAIIDTPNTLEYKLMGLMVIAGTFIWQIAIVVQKKYELQFKSRYLLFMLMVAYLLQLIFYIVFGKSGSQLIFPFGFLLATTVYLLLISVADIYNLMFKFFNKIKINNKLEG